jgi:hypothetical protein
MQNFSNLLLVGQLVLFSFFMANVGKLLIHLLIDNDAND